MQSDYCGQILVIFAIDNFILLNSLLQDTFFTLIEQKEIKESLYETVLQGSRHSVDASRQSSGLVVEAVEAAL